MLSEIVAMRRRIGLICRDPRAASAGAGGAGPPEMRVEETLGRPWEGLNDRLQGAMDAIDGARESLLGTYDIHMGRVSQHANDVMKALTLLSAVLLPAVVLAGVMGMNFKLEFFDELSNFFVVVGAMVVFAVVLLAVTRWRHWW